MMSFQKEKLEAALFVSPILDMEQMIRDMMQWAGVSMEQLEQEKEIPTDFGQTLSWDYHRYVVENPIRDWDIPTEILYGSDDNLTKRETVDQFVDKFGCHLTVMEHGEHWFHTREQLAVLDAWTEQVQ